MFKVMNGKAPNDMIKLFPKYQPTIRTRNNSIPQYKLQTNCFKYFFPSVLNDWFNLDINLKNSESNFVFKCMLFSSIRPV